MKMNRRQLIGMGGSSLLGAALLAACAHDTPPATRVGEAPDLATVTDPTIDDVQLLRLSASLENNMVEALTKLAPMLTGEYAGARTAAEKFIANHSANADALNALVTQLGGEPYTEPNKRISDLYITPALELIEGTDSIEASPTPASDALALAAALENLGAAAHQALSSVYVNSSVRKAAIGIAQSEARQATVFTRVLAPELTSVVPSINAETGAENVSALPSAFGQLSAISVSIGAPNESGNKTSLSLETPSLNAIDALNNA